ncbi:hypothetical protein, conserved [Eimeria tenella]|uniref:Uncharacterized protein n=1 Tax=Eimeria tenella TaxID=5802 RepID=U6KZ40_EIMTE|nr:hypothetical protein, conserved [Eimeria tenella]CDJ42203.1 hypothetical protein, conserved [Eimeria tenella]|eukprot:XP_013232953.1 hypothetical protein, conserved [Eimeria tenella]
MEATESLSQGQAAAIAAATAAAENLAQRAREAFAAATAAAAAAAEPHSPTLKPGELQEGQGGGDSHGSTAGCCWCCCWRCCCSCCWLLMLLEQESASGSNPQRPTQLKHAVEMYTIFIPLLLAGGLASPLASAFGGFLFLLGTFVYALGYYSGEAANRKWGSFQLVGLVICMATTLLQAIQLLRSA